MRVLPRRRRCFGAARVCTGGDGRRRAGFRGGVLGAAEVCTGGDGRRRAGFCGGVLGCSRGVHGRGWMQAGRLLRRCSWVQPRCARAGMDAGRRAFAEVFWVQTRCAQVGMDVGGRAVYRAACGVGSVLPVRSVGSADTQTTAPKERLSYLKRGKILLKARSRGAGWRSSGCRPCSCA